MTNEAGVLKTISRRTMVHLTIALVGMKSDVNAKRPRRRDDTYVAKKDARKIDRRRCFVLNRDGRMAPAVKCAGN